MIHSHAHTRARAHTLKGAKLLSCRCAVRASCPPPNAHHTHSGLSSGSCAVFAHDLFAHRAEAAGVRFGRSLRPLGCTQSTHSADVGLLVKRWLPRPQRGQIHAAQLFPQPPPILLNWIEVGRLWWNVPQADLCAPVHRRQATLCRLQERLVSSHLLLAPP